VIAGLASDLILGHKNVVLNPHYKAMGLYGSEYWTYLLPKRVGKAEALKMTESMLPVSMYRALDTGLVDDVYAPDSLSNCYDQDFISWVHQRVSSYLEKNPLDAILKAKKQQRLADEAKKPMEQYRSEELAKMKLNFAPGASYSVSRHSFVYKLAPKETPLQFALHRQSKVALDLNVPLADRLAVEPMIKEYTCAYKV
jgi:putative two-component system hydrogenase maturation factor HypX/HoxX